ncbi:MAG: DNA primase [Clostridia bacterium]|nr:DNA primase [Clostridia bacterium]
MISPEIVEEIKFRSDIEDVIASYVTLKHAGSNYNGLCPFHNEKTPSFTVFRASKSFYCFGCGAGGDVITFIMKAENLTYVEALEFLAKRAGITIPLSPEQEREGIRREKLLAMNRDAAKFFHMSLNDEKTGATARDYLYKKRGLSKAIINRFGLGYAPNSFNALSDYLRARGYTDEEMAIGFLCGVSKKTGKNFDMFRNRVMFPIIDVSGNVIAFGGRVLDDSVPKYLNSSDTPVFKKSRNLFALNFAKANASERLILCEGYMDVIALHAAGFENAVATLGTAITPEQSRIMAKYTKKVIVSYDSDEAGQRAASKALSLLHEVGIDGSVLKVVGAKDPDEFIRKNGDKGNIKFKHLLDNSESRFDFRLESILKKYDLAIPDQKLRASTEVCDMLADIYSNVERELACSAAAAKLGVSRESLKTDTERAHRRKNKEAERDTKRKIIMQTAGFGDRINTDAAKNKAASSAEDTILGLMLLYPEYTIKVKKGEIKLTQDDFFTAFNKKIFAKILDLTDETGKFEFGMLGEEFSPDEMGRITELRIRREKLTLNSEDILLDSINKLKNENSSTGELSDIEKILARKRADTEK